jgi:hypothetical protein
VRLPQHRKAATYFILFLFLFSLTFLMRFWAFRNKGSSKYKKKTRKKEFREIHLSSSQKIPPPPLPPPRRRFFERVVTRGVQKRDKKSPKKSAAAKKSM